MLLSVSTASTSCYNQVRSIQSQHANTSKIHDNLCRYHLPYQTALVQRQIVTETSHTHVMLEILLEIQEWGISQPKGLAA
jgi:hypothetical protein